MPDILPLMPMHQDPLLLPVDMQLLDTQMTRWNHIWLHGKCGHLIMINNATPCKIVPTIGEMADSHFDTSLTTSYE